MLAPQTYDQYGNWRLKQLQENPERFKKDLFPSDFLGIKRDLVRELGDVRGKRFLELGSGFGDWALWLARRGANISAIELGPTLVEASMKLAALNGVSIDFRQGSIHDPLPFRDGEFDVVTGLHILHHLEPDQLTNCLLEVHRVLKPNGKAYFFEPMENSPAFNFMQNIFPVGGAEPRPSILQRKKWREYLTTVDDRPLTDKELREVGKPFSKTELRHYGLTFRFRAVVGTGFDRVFDAIDELFMPALKRYGQTALIKYER